VVPLIDLTVIRVCEVRCDTCIFGPHSPISPARRREYERTWRRKDTFQNCHYGTVTGDKALVCRGFYDWCKATGWEPLAIQLGERLDRLFFVPVPELEERK
jgi:hypothetical protein